jgi:hypothetical protein
MPLQFKPGLAAFALATLACAFPCLGQTPQPAPAPEQHIPEQPAAAPTADRQPDPQPPGSISGTVIDESGAEVAGARVTLTCEGPSQTQEAISASDGRFSFADVAPGPFQITITSAGFATQASSGILHPGENYVVVQIGLNVATSVTEVEVGPSRTEVAEEQIRVEEKQRVLGVLPNFYVSYVPNAAPLDPKQKFKLAFKTVVDPFTLFMVGGNAGIEQAQNHFREYGQGAQGYGKRLGANYADAFTGTFIGGAILPSLLKQDPRYFYKGSGSTASRFLYAVANSLICKGDNGRWQANYSNVLGSLASGGISNLYYPPQDRNGAALTFENAAVGIGESAIGNLFQEFLIKKLTPKPPHRTPDNVPDRVPGKAPNQTPPQP